MATTAKLFLFAIMKSACRREMLLFQDVADIQPGYFELRLAVGSSSHDAAVAAVMMSQEYFSRGDGWR